MLLISNIIQRLYKELHTANSSFAFLQLYGKFYFQIVLICGWLNSQIQNLLIERAGCFPYFFSLSFFNGSIVDVDF